MNPKFYYVLRDKQAQFIMLQRNIQEGGKMPQLKASKFEVFSGVNEYVSVDITERIHLSRVSKQVKAVVRRGLKTGVLSSNYGKSGFVYRLLCKRHNLPMSFANQGSVTVDSRYSQEVRNQVLALHKLAGGEKVNSYTYQNHIYGSKLKATSLLQFVGEEYKRYADDVERALQDLDNGAVIETTMKIGE